MRLQTELMTAPRLNTELLRRDGKVLLVVENSGIAPIHDLQLSIDVPLPTRDCDWMQPLDSLPLFMGPRYFGAGRRSEIVIGDEQWVVLNAGSFPAGTLTTSYTWGGNVINEAMPFVVRGLWTDGQYIQACEEARAERAPSLSPSP